MHFTSVLKIIIKSEGCHSMQPLDTERNEEEPRGEGWGTVVFWLDRKNFLVSSVTGTRRGC